MKKVFISAMAATLIAGSAFAADANRLTLAPNATFATGAPATTNNDDSCDIAVTPAATLLLPYFEVDFNAPNTEGVNTIFTITNTSDQPQIAHVTIWTDWSYPVIDFNIFLTGYDVQGISLYDIIGRGQIPPTGSANTANSPRGPRSQPHTTAGNPNWSGGAAAACATLPGPIPAGLLAELRSALTTGIVPSRCGGTPVGGTNENAVGYVTVDVANTCSTTLPTDPTYYANEILFDNVLIGDYQRINPSSATGNYAGGNPMVHIRAIPEGGVAGNNPGTGVTGGYTNLPYTFYDRYVPFAGIDRRQPLPSLFAARYIQGGTGSFNTELAIWREGATGAGALCSEYDDNATLPFVEAVRFDERENPTTLVPECQISPCFDVTGTLPETSTVSIDDAGVFPPDFTGTSDLGGWVYLNLTHIDNQGDFAVGGRATQNWVTVQMTAEGRYGVDFDAAYLGNGCTPELGVTATTVGGTPRVGPAANFNLDDDDND